MPKYARKIFVRDSLGQLESDFFVDYRPRGWELDPDADQGTMADAFEKRAKKQPVNLWLRREIIEQK